ncbi:MAG TPA: hypothetical protein VFQ35_02795 [Polyangiaceae bacterium]|nr:hypothetical protein [Polyangiaceae bacterium]
MQIATLSAVPRRRAPRLLARPDERRLCVIVDVHAEAARERLVAELERLPLPASVEMLRADEAVGLSPRVRIAADAEIEGELELHAETHGSGRDAALVFELVQALAQGSFAVHVTFSETRSPRQLGFSSTNRR